MIENSRVAGGDGLRDNGFMSCSLVSNNIFTNSSDVIMRMTVTEGSRGAYIGNVGSEFANECELLLDCGSSIFVTETSDVPRSTITGNPADTDTITLPVSLKLNKTNGKEMFYQWKEINVFFMKMETSK